MNIMSQTLMLVWNRTSANDSEVDPDNIVHNALDNAAVIPTDFLLTLTVLYTLTLILDSLVENLDSKSKQIVLDY